jgi:hypothetical protein
VFAQVVSGFGLMIGVDWASLFKSFYEKIRVKVACKNLPKIPCERLFELDKKLYLVNITVEGFEHEIGDKSVDDGDDDNSQGDGEGGAQDDDDDDDDLLDDIHDMDTEGASGQQEKV